MKTTKTTDVEVLVIWRKEDLKKELSGYITESDGFYNGTEILILETY